MGEKHRERGTALEGELADWRSRALGEHKNVEEVKVKSIPRYIVLMRFVALVTCFVRRTF